MSSLPRMETPANPSALSADLGTPDVLVVDDSPTVAKLLEMGLRSAGFAVRLAQDAAQALALAQERCPDLVLADVKMPVLDGVQLTQRLREDPRTAATTIILVTSTGVAADKLQGFEAGADDYIVKPFHIDELLARVKGLLRRATVLRSQSPLTRLPGNIQIQEEIELRVRRQAQFALLYADLDNFKSYNDRYGFLRGDHVLQATARILQDAAFDIGGATTFVGHIGGDDFVIVTELASEQRIAETAIAEFDAAIPSHYDETDRVNGYVETVNRRREIQRTPIVALSIGVASTRRRSFSHHAEVVAVASEMKAFTKRTSGSSWAVDQRAGGTG
jgi:diguanylate cyclase (GGDEF)-like protein